MQTWLRVFVCNTSDDPSHSSVPIFDCIRHREQPLHKWELPDKPEKSSRKIVPNLLPGAILLFKLLKTPIIR